jgi:hypothetical protein
MLYLFFRLPLWGMQTGIRIPQPSGVCLSRGMGGWGVFGSVQRCQKHPYFPPQP